MYYFIFLSLLLSCVYLFYVFQLAWYLGFLCLFFFFKQNTASELRISYWSSDVCSSDLFWNLLAVWEAAAGLMFCAALARAPSPTLRLFAAAPLVLTILYVLSPAIGMIPMLVRAAMALVVLYLGLANWVLIRAAANGNRDALIVVPGIDRKSTRLN